MKRKAEAQRIQKLQKARIRKKKEAQWTNEGGGGGKTSGSSSVSPSSLIIFENEDDPDSHYINKPYILGRRSFGGFNPVIDAINEEALSIHIGKKIKKSSVSDKEMTHRYEKFVGLRGTKAEKYERRQMKSPQNSRKRRAARQNREDTSKKNVNREHPLDNEGINGRQSTKRPPRPFKKPKNVL
mmetsp:Transcript_47/g.66  ORF Transcript_47/g.66 Transcript_47/m.66 type:complete len:184 (-) Transcript_47:81-632(-)